MAIIQVPGDDLYSGVGFSGNSGLWSSDGITWTKSDFKASGRWYVGGPTSNGFVYAKSGTSSLISTDYGENWNWSNIATPISVGEQIGSDLNQIMWVNGTASTSSSNGTTWVTKGTLPSSSTAISAGGGFHWVCYANNRWVATGENGSAYSVNGGTTWQAGDTTKSFMHGVVWNGTYFVSIGVIAGNSAFIFTSSDGITWTQRGFPEEYNYGVWVSFTCNPYNGTIVLRYGGSNNVYYSTNNGVSWTIITTLPTYLGSAQGWGAVAFDIQTKLYVLSNQYCQTGSAFNDRYYAVATSSDLSNWVGHPPTFTGGGVHQVFTLPAYVNPKVTGVSESVALKTSSTSSVKTALTTNISSKSKYVGSTYSYLSTSTSNFSNIAHKLLSAIGISTSESFAIFKSFFIKTFIALSTSDAYKSWNIFSNYQTVSNTSSDTSFLRKIWKKPWSIIYAASKWVGVKNNTAIAATSSDGASWTTRTLPTNSTWTGIAHNGTIFAALSTGGQAATSTDGASWTTRTLPNNNHYHAIAAGGSTFVGVASSTSKCVTSTDGITWTERDMPSDAGWNAIAWNGTVFCAISNSNVCATSSDGITWTQHAMPDNINYTSITWALGQFTAVAAGPTNLAATSSDGASWTRIYMPQSANWTGVGPGVGIPNV